MIDIGSALQAASGKVDYKGFMLRFAESDVRWERRTFFAAPTPGGKSGLENGTRFSVIAAHSSAVVKGKGVPAIFFTFYFQLTGAAESRIPELRQRYKLRDGGKSDNTGVVPLIDRNIDLIIASYAGKESEKAPFGDLAVANDQIKKLFGCEFSAIDNSATHPRLQAGKYSCPNECLEAGRDVLHLHPWPNNIDDFIQSY